MSKRRDSDTANERHDRDQQILARLAKIEHKVDSFDQTQAFALRKDEAQHLGQVDKIFGRSVRRAQVYLAANGARGVQEIGEFLNMKRQNVGADLKYLDTEGLLELVDSDGREDIWAKKALDRTIRITTHLCDKFSLQKNGLPQQAKRKKTGRR